MEHTYVGPGLMIDGEVSGQGDVQVLGLVKGAVNLKNGLFIELGGVVEAGVAAHEVEIKGYVKGQINAHDRVEMKPGGKMIGDIRAPRIIIADGATIKGKIDMDVGA